VWAYGARFGRNVGHLLIEHWNGSGWKVTPTVKPGAYDELDAVSCAPGTARAGCVAVGYLLPLRGYVNQLLVETDLA
jgi:hypothetical protein